MEIEECGECGVWKMWSVEMRSMENEECVENRECGKCGVWKKCGNVLTWTDLLISKHFNVFPQHKKCLEMFYY